MQACNKHGVMLMEEAFDCWGKGKNVDVSRVILAGIRAAFSKDSKR